MIEVKHHQPDQSISFKLTDAAKQHCIKSILAQKDAIGVRFSIKKTGCSGLSYVVEYVDFVRDDDIILSLDESLHLYIEKKSYAFLKGIEVDYVRVGMGYKLVFNNPNQKGQCGCGESFTV